MAYAAEHIGLAALELLTYWANYPSMQGYDHYTYPLEEKDIEEALVTHPHCHPHDKRQTRALGDTWVLQQRTLALRVPSVVLPGSFNYVVNPNHPRYESGLVRHVGPFQYDQRIEALIQAAKG